MALSVLPVLGLVILLNRISTTSGDVDLPLHQLGENLTNKETNDPSSSSHATNRHICQPNVYLAPVINCSTGEIITELHQLRQEVTLLNERVHRLTQHIGSALPGILARSCLEVLETGLSTGSGVYIIQPDHGAWPFQVYCDMDTDGGGWTVFQRRMNGSVNFYRTWASYRRGFGDQDGGEFWLGNDKLHQITALDEYELRVDMEDFDNISQYAKYGQFYVENFENNYRLHVRHYSGAAGDSMSFSNNQEFSTNDRDNDAWSENCAQHHSGAWWYKDCMKTHPNGLYLGGRTEINWNGVIWNTWKGQNYSLKKIEMKIRPVTEE